MKGELLLGECAPLGEALEALQAAPGVMDAAVFGNALHLVVPDAAFAIPQLKDFLSARGVAVSRIEKIRPSLEDAFVSITTSRDAAPERRTDRRPPERRPEGRRPEEHRP